MEILKPHRARIDALDDQIIDLLAQRMDIVREVGGIKAREHIAPVQAGRVEQVCNRCAEMGAQKGLNPDMVRKIYMAIIDEAHDMERAIANK